MIDQTPPPTAQDMPTGHHEVRRGHLLAEAAAQRRTLPRRRLVLGGVGALALAGLAAVLVVVTPGGSGSDGWQRTLDGDAERTFVLAANTAAAAPDLKPRLGQFVYVESKERGLAEGDRMVTPAQGDHRKVWLPVDYERQAGLLLNKDILDPAKARPWERTWLCSEPTGDEADSGPNPPEGCHYGSPAFRSGLPTSPDAMRKWLYKNSDGDNPQDVQAFITVGDTIREAYVPPAALAAMFRAAARIPGVTVTRNVVDAVGRKGIGVGPTWQGNRQELIFDARTYRFLGSRTIDTKTGKVRFQSVNLKVAVVDRVGQEP
ncbi:CU044_5270 family protein [Spirillospora sp. CA-294931]|uniref:CU044_5270 family protein n=1 Tax=Spirillospora sp. CA-294931 TaxID=3240042 RepID=UPI003D94C9D5